MKHTQGPWRVGDAGQTIFGPKTEKPAPQVVATIAYPNSVTPQEAQANARLVAAAPELLAVAEELLAYELGQRGGLSQCVRMAQAAIKKAKGE